MHGRFSTEWSLHKHSLVLLVFMRNMNLSDYISEKWVLSLRKNSNECSRTSWVAHSIFTHSWWQDLCKQEKKIPSIVSSFYTDSIQTNCVFLSLMKSPSFLPLSMCVCVSLSHTHVHLRDFVYDLFFSAWDYGYLSLLFWWWCSELNSQIQFNRLEKVKTSSLHLFFWNLCLLVYILLSYSWLCCNCLLPVDDIDVTTIL